MSDQVHGVSEKGKGEEFMCPYFASQPTLQIQEEIPSMTMHFPNEYSDPYQIKKSELKAQSTFQRGNKSDKNELFTCWFPIVNTKILQPIP